MAFTRVGVRDMIVMADIGIDAEEIGRRQPLGISVTLWIGTVRRASVTIDKPQALASGIASTTTLRRHDGARSIAGNDTGPWCATEEEA